MSGIPLDLERRFERRWAARFSGPAKERHVKAQQQQQRVTVPEESKRRRRGTGGFAISNLRPILSLRFWAGWQKKTRQVESAGADVSPRIGYAPEAVMSDQDDWEFSGADDAKAEIRAAVGYLLPGATGGIRGDIVQVISIVRQVAAGLPPVQLYIPWMMVCPADSWRGFWAILTDCAQNYSNGMGHFSERYGATSLTLFDRLEPFRRDDPMNILPVDRVLSIYGSLADRAETRGARERLSKHLMKMFIDGEKDEHRLTMQGLSFLQDMDREIDSRN
jgi:hypothetical protein